MSQKQVNDQLLVIYELNADLFECPCCGQPTLSEPGVYEICNVCGWEDDLVQSKNPDYAGGANIMSLNEYREKWMDKK